MRTLTLLVFLALFRPLIAGAQVYDYSGLDDPAKLVLSGKTIPEKYELQKDYLTLMGILEDLNGYRDNFLKTGAMIDLFPTAYYQTTKLEMARIVNGDFVYPIEKMKQTIAFYEAYKYNRLKWDRKAPGIEPQWREQFEYAESVKADLFCKELGEVLAKGIIAHMIYDFPRTIKYAFDQRYNRLLKYNDPQLKLEFQTTQTLFETSAELTLADVALSPRHCREQFINLSPEMVEVLKNFFPGHPLTNAKMADDVIALRNDAYAQAFSGKPFLGKNNAVLMIHPNPDNLSAMLASGKKRCHILETGSVNPSVKILDADSLGAFTNGLAVVHKGGMDALIRPDGSVLVGYGKYLFAEPDPLGRPFFQSGLCKVYRKVGAPYYKMYGFIDLSGTLVIPYDYVYAGFYAPNLGFGRLPVPNDKPLHLIDGHGTDLGVNLMNTMLQLDNGVVTLSLLEQGHGENRRYGFTDYRGQIQIPATYLGAHYFHEGLAAVKKGPDYYHGKWGFIDRSGKVVVPFVYDNPPGDFSCGRAAVNLGANKYGYIDHSGKLVTALAQTAQLYTDESKRFKDWTTFKGNVVLSGNPAGEWNDQMLLDTAGHRIPVSNTDFRFRDPYTEPLVDENELLPIDAGMFPHEKKGLLSGLTEVLLPPVFDQLSPFDPVSGLAYAQYSSPNGKRLKGYVDINGVFQFLKR